VSSPARPLLATTQPVATSLAAGFFAWRWRYNRVCIRANQSFGEILAGLAKASNWNGRMPFADCGTKKCSHKRQTLPVPRRAGKGNGNKASRCCIGTTTRKEAQNSFTLPGRMIESEEGKSCFYCHAGKAWPIEVYCLRGYCPTQDYFYSNLTRYYTTV
jgi:hypothetical protein